MPVLADGAECHSAQPWAFLGLSFTHKVWEAKQEARPQGRTAGKVEDLGSTEGQRVQTP